MAFMSKEELEAQLAAAAGRIPGGDKVLQGIQSSYGDLSQGRVPAWPPAPPPQSPDPGIGPAGSLSLLDPVGAAKAGAASPAAVDALKHGDVAGAMNQAGLAQRPELNQIAAANQAKAAEAKHQYDLAHPKQVDPNEALFANPQSTPGAGGWRPPPMQIIPAHEGQTTSPRVERQMLLGQNRIEAGAREGVDAEAAAQEGLSKLNDRRAEQYEDFAQQQEKREDARQRILNGHFKDQEQLAQEIRAQKFDPEGFWGKGADGATKKVTAVIAQALGGFVQGMRGGPNAATQMIDAAQDRYMDAMKQQMAAKKETLAEGSNLLAQKMRQFGDERTAELAAKDDMLHATQAQIESFMAQSQSAAVRARGDQLLGEIQQKRGELMNKLHPWVQAQAVGGMGGPGGAGGAGTLEGEALHLGGGKYVQAKGQIGNDLAKNLQASQTVISQLSELKKLIAKRSALTAAGGSTSAVENDIQNIAKNLAPTMTQVQGAGAPSKEEAQSALVAMGLPQGIEGLTDPSNTRMIDATIKRYQGFQDSNLRRVGGTTYNKVGQRIGKSGKWEDLYVPAGDVTDMPDTSAAPPPASASFKPVGGK